ncbi:MULTISPECIES: cytochrome c-type biogenesis protein [Pseudomonas]|uniref:Cytochrome c-type biogenesis protein n=2 Tax=Pseudomonas TaxID=286 RepID=A0A178LAR6_9PSED|nr:MULTISPECIES: cytochrome c-type biogenesis protein [Pseudomonas]MCD4863263.1 cytochrome c-type biogenesis protein CcmH [Pseudomonas sp. PLB05]MDC7828217.1 cytochrome c-type biogenesis protein CcmH [Pseudomonas benzopyrenica]NRH41692.1 cytochrome c-type biogenesis protein CcmH [Pseudomonas sp. MS15a(2019)]OAN25993.1 cytochrome C [Pseudomonas oryzihabitans]SEO94822.1 cytochrome c-type biogenesis protein CcmH [Pseudomonas sp. Snoq117.2]
MRVGWLLLLLVWSTLSQAAIDPYGFRDDAERARFQALTRELRCPKCQNQDLADSNAPIAGDLRREIQRLMAAGRSDEEIIAHLEQRYGEFIRYRPPFEGRTLLLWLLPGLALLAGAGLLLVLTRRRRPEQTLSDAERQRLAQLQAEEEP